MEIVIHGTKKGRKIFTPNKIEGLFDVTPDSPKIKAIGQSAYALRFFNNSIIFSKYKIIKDILGEKRIGFLGFSLFLSNTEKLSGTDIITLLDKVSEEYSSNYIVDNNWNEVTEDWGFVERLTREYLSKVDEFLVRNTENILSGNLDEAFIYYNDDDEIRNYFDQSYRFSENIFLSHRQIFFISESLKNLPENPLNALRNSGTDLTGIIDFKNPPFILRDFTGFGNNGISITIKNSNGRVLEKGDKIYNTDLLTIIYSKKYFFHAPIEGNLFDDNIQEYLKVRDYNKIDVKNDFNSFEPLEKIVELEIIKKDGNDLLKPIIICKSINIKSKEILNNKVVFSGEELNKKWECSVTDGDYKGRINIVPEEKKHEKIILIRKRIVKLNIFNENGEDIILVYKVSCHNHRDSNKFLSEIEFIEDEIEKTWNIYIYGNNDYEDSSNKQFCPAKDGNEITFNLKKTTNSKEVNTLNNKTETNSKGNISKDPFKESHNVKKIKLIIFLTLSGLILGVGIWGLSRYYSKSNNQEVKFTAEQINEYLQGDSLILNKLNKYKANWEKQNPEKNNKENGFWSLILPHYTDPNSEELLNSWNETNDSIKNAIVNRKLIDKKDFEKLKVMQFKNCKTFEETISKIKIGKYKLLKKSLGDVSKLTLTSIAKKIDSLLNIPPPVNDVNVNSGTTQTGGSGGSSLEKGDQTNVKSNGSNHTSVTTEVEGGNNSEIIKKLKSGEITRLNLENYKNEARDPQIIKSINLLSELWTLTSDDKSLRNYSNKVNSNNYLKENSVLKNIVSEMIDKVKESKSWGKFKGTESLNKISEKLKNN